MKYIDADKLKQEIEKRFWAYGTPLHDDEVTTKADEILSFIDSLQQDQPEVDLEKEEYVGVAESPLKTFQRVNEFEDGANYRH